jgi:ribonuclease PH
MTSFASTLRRREGRAVDALRPVRFELGVLKHAEGSVLIEAGDTRVLVAATVENRVPPFLAGKGQGWVTAEYAMLPRATSTRSPREVQAGRPSGRSSEIQRLVGRSLRSVVDLGRLGERSVIVDCDVLQADAGTRCAAITGGYVALVSALSRLFLAGDLVQWPLTAQVAAVSVGICEGVPLLDLDYDEDQRADVDMNVVATEGGELVEIQGTAERRRFSRPELDALLDLAFAGIAELAALQRGALASQLAEVETLRAQGGRRKPAPARDERDLWRGGPAR